MQRSNSKAADQRTSGPTIGSHVLDRLGQSAGWSWLFRTVATVLLWGERPALASAGAGWLAQPNRDNCLPGACVQILYPSVGRPLSTLAGFMAICRVVDTYARSCRCSPEPCDLWKPPKQWLHPSLMPATRLASCFLSFGGSKVARRQSLQQQHGHGTSTINRQSFARH